MASLAASLAGGAARFLADISGLTQQSTCTPGTFDCEYLKSLDSFPKDFKATTCAAYDGGYKSVEGNVGLLIAASIGMALMAFSIGANDGANALATSVHSFAISMRKAVILGAIFEVLGAATLGYGVSTSLQRGITDVKDENCFACGRCNSEVSVYYVGMLCALFSAGTFVTVCSWFKLPVSSTHSIVGAVIGMTVSSVGFGCLKWGWKNLGGIFGSWVISPALSAVLALITYYVSEYVIFRARNPRKVALFALPVIYFAVLFSIGFLSVNKAPALKSIPKYWSTVSGACAGAAGAIFAIVVLLPYVKRNMPSVNSSHKLNYENLVAQKMQATGGAGKQTSVDASGVLDAEKTGPSGEFHEVSDGGIRSSNVLVGVDTEGRPLDVVREYESLTDEQQDAMWMFKYLLVIAACFEAYAHGSNETANATAAFSAVIQGFQKGEYACSNANSQWWIMLIGGCFLGLGIIVLGYKVMETLGKDLALFSYHRGFCVELGSSITIVMASVLQLPVSSTHCQVGAVVAVGAAAFGLRNIKWKLLAGIFSTWVITVPANALLSAFLTYLVQFAFRD